MREMNVNRTAMEIGVSGLLTQPGTSDLRHMRKNTHNYVTQKKKKKLKYLMRAYVHIVFILQKNLLAAM